MSYPLTAVSGYWTVKNKHDNKYNRWFENTLRINCPYVFFGNSESIDLAKSFRRDLPTYYIECEIEDFYTYKYKDRMRIHPIDSPSAELNMIWNEKLFLIEKAARLNPYNSEFFAWIDAGICTYRNKMPPNVQFPNSNKLALLPKDKFIFTTSEKPFFEPHRLNTYYHHIAGTSYILHKNILQEFIDIFIEYLEKIMKPNGIYTDQIILTHMFNDYPELFYKLGNGYGEVVPLLY
jgi:hypothetical protein